MITTPMTFGRDRRPHGIVALVVSVGLLVAAIAYSVNPYVFQFYGDANSRLVQTRMMVDSVSPGVHWLGSVWLPLPGLLFLPFSLIDALFYTGLAGLVVCLPLLAWTAARLYRWVVALTGHRGVATGIALVFAINPNTLYISMTSMTETVTLFFVVGAVWHWSTWVERRLEPAADRLLLLGSLNAAGATLCRYEAWPFVAVAMVALTLIVLTLRGSIDRTMRLLGAMSTALIGIALWVAWNWTQFGDPLLFHRAEYYSAAWQALSRDVRDAYYLQLGNSLGIYWTTMVAVFGYVFLSAAAVGAVLLVRRKPVLGTAFMVGLLLVMPVFTLVSLYLGVAEMTRWWNSRYVLLLAPFVYVTAGVASVRVAALLPRPGHIALVIAAGFVLTTGWQAGWQHGRVVTVADAAGGFYYRQTPPATEVGELLRREWQQGQVLCATGSGQSHRIIQPSWVQVRHFVTALNHDRQHLDMEAVSSEFTWVIIGLEPSADGAEIAAGLLAQTPLLEEQFERVHTNASYVVFRRRSE